VPKPPQGLEKLHWYGPGLLWMLSAVGTGSILFTPRVGSVYQYELFWILVLVVFFMWVMIKEMARFSVVTGKTMLDGMSKLSGPKNWAVWIIFIPQLFAASVGIAGLSAIVGSAFSGFFSGEPTYFAIATVIFCVAITTFGKYMLIENISKVLGAILMGIVIFSAYIVFPNPQTVLGGLNPSLPQDIDLYIILPWVGTILAGSMGIVWFSYWISTRGFGGGFENKLKDDETPSEVNKMDDDKIDKKKNLKEWIKIVDTTALVGVLGGLIIITSFLILGSELLAPKEILPSGSDVAIDLSKLFSNVWGDSGKFIILVAIIIALGGSVLANQDGWGRSFADMSYIVGKNSFFKSQFYYSFTRFTRMLGIDFNKAKHLKKFYIITITGIIPIAIIMSFQDPVAIMSASGIIAAIHTPFIVLTALLVNIKILPKEYRPSLFYILIMVASGIFYLGFALLYIL
jgi:Mn2+/Fe2+ NRAMP family transporter